MKEYTNLEVQFIFDPSSSWAHVSQFESDLADFFSAYGMEAQSLKTIGGQPGKKIFLIRKVEVIKRLDNKAESSQSKVNIDPRKSFKQTKSAMQSFKTFSNKSIVPKPQPQQKIRYSNNDFNRGKSTVRKVYLPK